MKLIEVIPLSRGIGKETLSYFTASEVNEGAIVEVPLRSKKISALVVRVQDALLAKAEIKTADFSMKKVETIKTADLFTPTFIEAARDTAKYFATSTGSILSTLIPKVVLLNIEKLQFTNQTKNLKNKLPEKSLVQGEDEERFSSYRSHIRQEFAQKKSILFCVPTIEDARRGVSLLEKGIEKYTFALHGGLKQKEIIPLWKKIIEQTHPVVIIVTPNFLSIFRPDINSIIVEKENNKSYKLTSRPYFDIRFFLEKYAEHMGAKLFFGDTLLRTESLWREEEGELLASTPFKFRSLSTSSESLIDMREYKTSESGFKIVSPEVEQLIKDTKANNEHLFILTTRRGLSPTTLCGDCQNIVTCNNCDAPVILHNQKKDNVEQNYFLCHRCGARRSAEETCKTCNSWKLATVGIGIELVEEKIKKRFPDIKVFRIDSDIIKTDKALRSTLTSFYSNPGSILIGTEMALSYLHEKIENSVIISIDSLFSIPDFKIHEKILYTILKIRSITSKTLILQTRNPNEKILDYALKGNLIDFYRNEINMRKTFEYPPFSILIKITLEGEREAIDKEMTRIKEILNPYPIDIFPSFTKTPKGKSVLHSLIKIDRKLWPDPQLLEKLYTLPPHVMIKVDPESLL
ncbi:MAG: hypothetical protein EXS50_00600 [Candidatus Taylorbacteria bacterium]|nr:hypothetical protein [Candidatus Taylorbacteria bacterium]